MQEMPKQTYTGDRLMDPTQDDVASRVPRLAAWFLRDGNRDIVPGMPMRTSDGTTIMRPLMGDLEGMQALREVAQGMANQLHKPLRLVQSTGFEVVEELAPKLVSP